MCSTYVVVQHACISKVANINTCALVQVCIQVSPPFYFYFSSIFYFPLYSFLSLYNVFIYYFLDNCVKSQSMHHSHLFMMFNKLLFMLENLCKLRTCCVELFYNLSFLYTNLFSTCIYIYKNNFLRCSYVYSSCKIICLYVTNLFKTPNYLFILQIKLFRDINQFVRGIFLFILYN